MVILPLGCTDGFMNKDYPFHLIHSLTSHCLQSVQSDLKFSTTWFVILKVLISTLKVKPSSAFTGVLCQQKLTNF